MAREFARYMASTHHDCDWHKLTTAEHDCYMALLSSPEITWAGVTPYLPGRYASLAADLTDRKVESIWKKLAESGYLLIDKATGEVLVRTFVKHENVIAKPNLTKALMTARGNIRSLDLRDALDAHLGQIMHDRPTLPGWDTIAELNPDLFEELSRQLIGDLS